MEIGLSLQGGYLRRIPPNAGSGEQISALNDVIDRLNDLLKLQVLSDNANKRYVSGFKEGRWPGGDFGIAISQEGQDVTTAEFEDLLFAWDFSTGTQYWRNPEDGIQYRQDGKLPDGTFGFILMKEGEDVADAF